MSRDDYRCLFGDLTAAELLVAAYCAETTDEVDTVAHLSLLLLGHRGCSEPTNLPSGHSLGSVHAAITRRRAETPHFDVINRAATAAAHAEKAKQIRVARAQEAKAARERQRAPRLNNPSGAPL